MGKKIRIIIFIIGLLISAFLFIIMALYYKEKNEFIITTSLGSYAYNFAKDNSIEVSISDHYSVWEDFKYEISNDNKVTITKYEGISEELRIPSRIKGSDVIKIEKGAIPDTVKKIYLPDEIETIDIDDYNDKEIICGLLNDKCRNLYYNGIDNIKMAEDTSYYFIQNEMNFEYKMINSNEIEITKCIGTKYVDYKDYFTYFSVPKTINGYKVTSLNCDGSGINYMTIPDTVKTINKNIIPSYFTTETTMVLLAIVLVVISFSIPLSSNKIYELLGDTFDIIPIANYIISNYIIVYYARDNIEYSIITIIVSSIYLIIYLAIIKFYKKRNNNIENKNNTIVEENKNDL